MKVGILGTGFISDSYLRTLHLHPGLQVIGAYDRDAERARLVADAFKIRSYESLGSFLEDGEVELVLNLTNPREHAALTEACLHSGKHVYSEKPLAMEPEQAQSLVAKARSCQSGLGTAPCSVLAPCAQTLWQAIRSGLVGKVRMVYANFDDGMIAPHAAPWTWRNSLGIPWPARDEFEIGCTYEHAGYFLSWLCSFFGPVRRLQSFAATCIADKGIPVDKMAPDFTVGCLEFGEGIVARVTCGLVAPKDKSITVIGEEGILGVENLRDDYGSVRYQPRVAGPGRARIQRWLRGAQRRLPGFLPSALRNPITLRTDRKLPMPTGLPRLPVGGEKRVDFLRGPAEMAAAIREGRPNRLPGELGAHIVEIIHQLQYPESHPVVLATSFPSLEPMGVNDEN